MRIVLDKEKVDEAIDGQNSVILGLCLVMLTSCMILVTLI